MTTGREIEKPESVVPLVPGVFRTIRAFRVVQNGLRPMSILASANAEYRQPGVWYEATCGSIGRFFNHVHIHKGQSVDPLCSCGFYSFYEARNLASLCLEYVTFADDFNGRLTSIAVAIIENGGKVFHHEAGVRSERMRLLDQLMFIDVPLARQHLFSDGFFLPPPSFSDIILAGRCGMRKLPGWVRDSGFTVVRSIDELVANYPLSPAPEGILS